MSVRLIDSLATTEPFAEVFSDISVLQAMLDFEVALARAQGELKIIPQSVARAIAQVARAEKFDAAALARETLRAGTPGIPLVKALRKQVHEHNPKAADFVHWGATSQDVADTALVLLLKKSAVLLDRDLQQLERSLTTLTTKHKRTVMLGRTLLQPAPPVTFSLKAAGWLGAVTRSRARLQTAFSQALILQLGGASGTLAALGKQGVAVGESVAKQLGLACPEAPWHTQRDRLASLVGECGVLVGSLGKMARDISLLMQAEVDEVSEPQDGGRGGSSTMPQKRNPIASAITLAAASRMPGLAAAYLSQMPQEHERALGGWQAEWSTISSVVQTTGVALASMREAAAGLSINEQRMKQNLEATRGTIFAEKAALPLSRKLGRERAHKLLERATDPRQMRNRSLSDVLSEIPELDETTKSDLANLQDPEAYLGVAREFTERLLRSGNKRTRRRN